MESVTACFLFAIVFFSPFSTSMPFVRLVEQSTSIIKFKHNIPFPLFLILIKNRYFDTSTNYKYYSTSLVSNLPISPSSKTSSPYNENG